jgi:hypothetical protein
MQRSKYSRSEVRPRGASRVWKGALVVAAMITLAALVPAVLSQF